MSIPIIEAESIPKQLFHFDSKDGDPKREDNHKYTTKKEDDVQKGDDQKEGNHKYTIKKGDGERSERSEKGDGESTKIDERSDSSEIIYYEDCSININTKEDDTHDKSDHIYNEGGGKKEERDL